MLQFSFSSHADQSGQWKKYAPFLKVGCDFTDVYVSITGTELIQDSFSVPCAPSPKFYTLYHICIQFKDSSRRLHPKNDVKVMTFGRRYRQFYDLYEKLFHKYPEQIQSPDFPKFPPKKLFGNKKETLIEERRSHLEKFLKALVENDRFRHEPHVEEFLKLKEIEQQIVYEEVMQFAKKQTEDREIIKDMNFSEESFKAKYFEAKQEAEFQLQRRTSESEEWLKILQSTEKEQLLHCKICYDTRVEVALQPCGHSLMCETCARKFAACPVCRMFITKRLRIYL